MKKPWTDSFGRPERVMVAPPGEEAAFLAPLPLETLPLPLPARLALQRLGVRTLGGYARLPANSVAHRYGELGRQAHRLAQGLDDTPLRPQRPAPAARVEMTFEWEETALDRLTLLSAGSEPRVGALFADAELRRSYCGQRDPILAPTPKHQLLWKALGVDPASPSSAGQSKAISCGAECRLRGPMPD